MAGENVFLIEKSEYEELVRNDVPFWCIKNKTLRNGTTASAWHEQLEIKYVLSGRMNVICDSGVIEAERGDLVIVNPCERHFTNVPEGGAVSYHLFMIDLSESSMGALFKHAFSHYLNEEYRFRNRIRNAELRALFLDLIRACDPAEKNYVTEVYARFLLFFARLEVLGVDPARKKRHFETVNGREKTVSTALEWIYAHYMEPIGLEELAGRCAVTKEHFCRIFKKTTGKTPTDFINGLRMNKAAVLLAHTDLNINEVAFHTGFRDNSYFSRRFKRFYGVSPQEYRKTQGEES